ncbi:MAG: FAD-binding oxidoreductase [Halobacteria archaeon]|nr:FAD-binding oxidoreductase [Halobacteria archaeon]
MNADVVIVGGGLMGSSAALHLAMRGQRVIVMEKDSPGRHASGVNAGGLRQLNRHPAEIPLAAAAARLWRDIQSLVDSDCDVKLSGQVRVAENEADMRLLEERAAQVRALGYEHEIIIDREQLYRLVPRLAPHCVGALYTRDDGFARPFHALTAFRHKAESLGVQYRTGSRVHEVARQGEDWQVVTDRGCVSAPVLVNCSGAWSQALCSMLGEPVTVNTGAPMMMVTERLPHFLDPVVGAASRKLSFKQMQNGTVLIGGAHLANYDMKSETTAIDFIKLSESARSAVELFPHVRDAHIVRTWAGLEAFTPDHLPVISPGSCATGVFHAFGFSAHGFQLSPIVGLILSELIIDGKSELPIGPFSIKRFLDETATGCA